MIENETWFLHMCLSRAQIRLMGYLDKIRVRVNPLSERYVEIEIDGFDRGDIHWAESGHAHHNPNDATNCIDLLSAKLVEKVRRFEEDRELNLTP